MKFVPAKVTLAISRQILNGQKHSPTIMFASGVVGVIGAAVLASQATLKIDKILEEAQIQLDDINEVEHDKYSEFDRKQDKTVVYVKLITSMGKTYAPAIIVGTISVGLLTGSHVVLSRRNVGLTAAYAAVEKGFSEYRERVLKEVGPDKERELRYGYEEVELARDTKQGVVIDRIKRVDPNGNSIYARFFDELCSPWKTDPEYNRIFLQAQQTFANDRLHAKGYVFLNDVYEGLGIPKSKAGQVVGWVLSKDNDNYIDFGIFRQDTPEIRDFVNGREGAILLDFNVDGVVYDKIEDLK